MKPRLLIPALFALAGFGCGAFADLGSRAAGASVEGGAGRAQRPSWLGVQIAEAPLEISARLPVEPGTGLVVQMVVAASPAAIAGLQPGDFLARLNDQTLVTPRQLQTMVMHRKPGEQVEITFFRKGEKRRVVVVLMPRENM